MQQPQTPPTTSTQQQEAQAQPVQARKAGKNLYIPYIMPGWLWEILRATVHGIFSLILNVKLVGRENMPKKGPFIVAANHISWTDVPLVPAYLTPQGSYIAKEELYASPIGWLVRFLGAIPVKRGEADRQLLRASNDLLKAGRVLIIFPEGTRSRTRTMNPAHAGVGMIALRADVPVVPVAIHGSEYALRRFRPRVTMVCGAPMHLQPKGAKITKDDIKSATETIMRQIAEMLPESYRGVYASEASAQAATGQTPEVQ